MKREMINPTLLWAMTPRGVVPRWSCTWSATDYTTSVTFGLREDGTPSQVCTCEGAYFGAHRSGRAYCYHIDTLVVYANEVHKRELDEHEARLQRTSQAHSDAQCALEEFSHKLTYRERAKRARENHESAVQLAGSYLHGHRHLHTGIKERPVEYAQLNKLLTQE